MDELLLAAPQRGWWDRFQRGLSAPGPDAAPVWERWSRSRDLGVAPEVVHPEEGLTRGSALREHQERVAPLWHEVAPLFAQTAAAAAQHHFKLLLAGPDGVVTHAAGGGAFAPVARDLRLIEGASWSETARGTNAIGTALAEGRPMAVVGAAHYTRSFHELVCYGAPIRDVEGRVVAVLDASSAVVRAEPAVAALVAAAALAMEASWRAQAWAAAGLQAAGLLERTLDRVDGPAFLVEAPGRIVRCNPAARVELGRPGEVAVLGVDWGTLRSAATGKGNASFILPRFGEQRGVRARLEPLAGPTGLLAVAVFVERPPRRGGTSAVSYDPREGAVPARGPEAPDSLVTFNEPRARLRGSAPPARADAFAAVYADDPVTRAAVDLGRRVAPSDLPIVLLAETGSGKERFAEALHAASRRRDGPFVAVNCGSFAPELLAAELFGHGPGAFTGADRAGRDGLLHAASGGTLFLDEIADMPPAMQVALLRVLEDGRYERVGERTPRRADVRVVCGTCRDLPGLVARGEFRQDLWFRLKGVVLRLPPLRDRTDRLGLARFLLQAVPGAPEIGRDLAAFIERYPWPGNVRELKSVLEVAVVLADGGPTLGVEHLPPDLVVPEGENELPDALGEVQVWAIQRALESCKGNVSAAARRLGVARSTIYRVLGRR